MALPPILKEGFLLDPSIRIDQINTRLVSSEILIPVEANQVTVEILSDQLPPSSDVHYEAEVSLDGGLTWGGHYVDEATGIGYSFSVGGGILGGRPPTDHPSATLALPPTGDVDRRARISYTVSEPVVLGALARAERVELPPLPPRVTQHSVAHGTVTSAGVNFTNPVTMSYTTTSGDDGLLIAVFGGDGDTTAYTSASFNGDPLTLTATYDNSTQQSNTHFLMAAPDIGTYTASVTANNTYHNVNTIIAVSLTGVHQTTPIKDYDATGAFYFEPTHNTVTVDTDSGGLVIGTVAGTMADSLTQIGSTSLGEATGTGSGVTVGATTSGIGFNWIVATSIALAAGGGGPPAPDVPETVTVSEFVSPNMLLMPSTIN